MPGGTLAESPSPVPRAGLAQRWHQAPRGLPAPALLGCTGSTNGEVTPADVGARGHSAPGLLEHVCAPHAPQLLLPAPPTGLAHKLRAAVGAEPSGAPLGSSSGSPTLPRHTSAYRAVLSAQPFLRHGAGPARRFFCSPSREGTCACERALAQLPRSAPSFLPAPPRRNGRGTEGDTWPLLLGQPATPGIRVRLYLEVYEILSQYRKL